MYGPSQPQDLGLKIRTPVLVQHCNNSRTNQIDCQVLKNSREAGTSIKKAQKQLVRVIKLMKNMEKFASVKVPWVGGKSSLSMLVKLPKCVAQQVASTSVAVSKLSSTSFEVYPAKNYRTRMAALWNTWACTCSRWWACCRPQTSLCLYQWRLSWFGLCLQLAESFSTNSSSWKIVAESFLVSSILVAGSVWMPVHPNST